MEDEGFFQADIYLPPPSNGNVSDQDSDAEEESSIQHLPPSILETAADFRIQLTGKPEDVDSMEGDVTFNNPTFVPEAQLSSSDSSDSSDLSDVEMDNEDSSHEERGTKYLSSSKPPNTEIK